MEQQEKLIKAVNAELEYWLLSGDVDYLRKAVAVIQWMSLIVAIMERVRDWRGDKND